MRSSSLQAEATDPPADVVYDLYTLSKDADPEGTSGWHEAPVVYVSSANPDTPRQETLTMPRMEAANAIHNRLHFWHRRQ